MPQIGEKRPDGKVWVNDRLGWQFPATIWKNQGPGEKEGEIRELPGLGSKVWTGSKWGWQTQATIDKKKTQQPKTPDPKPAPAAPDPKPAPAASDPKPAPAASDPKPAPAASDPKPAPAASDPKPEKKYQFTVGDKSYDLTKAQINKTYRDPKALGGVDPVAFGRAANQAIYQWKKPTPRRYTHPSVESKGAGAPMGGPYNEAYDVVLDYLLSEGHADTVEEAHYVMMQLDAEYIQQVIQERAWWDPLGFFKSDKEKALEKPSQGYDPNKGTTRLGPEGGPYTPQIIAPRGGIPGAMEGKPETWTPLTDKAAPNVMSRYKAVRGANQLAKDVKDNAAAAEIAKLEAQAKAQQAKLDPSIGARETLAPAPIVAPKPVVPVAQPKPVVATAQSKPVVPVAQSKPVVATAQPTSTPTVAKRPSILSDVDDLKRMRAASLMRQQGRRLPSGKIPVGSDLKPGINEKFPDVKGTLNPWESPRTGSSGVKLVTDPKTGKPVEIRNPLYKGV